MSAFGGRRLKTASGVAWFNKSGEAEALLTAWAETMAYEPNHAAPDDQALDLLVNDDGRTYVGYTKRNPLNRLLLEHNKNGGKRKRYTRTGGKWYLLYSVHGFPNNGAAKAFEEALKKKSIGSRQIRDAPLKKQVQLLLMLAKAEYRQLVVCGHWMRNSPFHYTRSVPIRQTYTEDTLLAAGFNPSDAKAYSEVREPFPRQ